MIEQYQQIPLTTNKKTMTHMRLSRLLNKDNSLGIFIESTKRLWRALQLDEWTFTLLLFIFSSSIVIGKLFLNHDSFSFLDINNHQIIVITNNRSHQLFDDIIDNTVLEPLNNYSWIIKAIFCGLATIGITWFIIYEDSNIPGINPPSPFNPSKKRIIESHSLQINYFVGILNGLLVFLYMCLEK